MSALVDGSEASERAASPPFDAKRTRRFKRMFDKYCDPGGLIGEADLSKLFEDCGTAGPTSAAGLYDLLERFKSHDDGAREDAKEGLKVRVMLSWMGASPDSASARAPLPMRVSQVSFEGFLEMAKYLEETQSNPGPEPSFFGSIYTQFISSNSLTDLVKLHDDRPATPFDEAKTRRFRRMFDKYCDSSDRMIGEADLGQLFEDCGAARPAVADGALQRVLDDAGAPYLVDRFACSAETGEPGVIKITFESFLTLAHALEKQPDEVNDGTQDEMGRAKGDTPGFFGRIYKVFVSSNNLAELAK